MNIIFFGDSLVWGGYGGDFVAEVARLLPAHTIVNAGEAGSTVLNLINRQDAVLSQQPDGIFVFVGGNDAISYSQPAARPYYQQVQKIPEGLVTPEMFEQGYRTLLERFLQAGIRVWAALEPLEYNPETLAAMRRYNALAADIALALDVPVLDLLEYLAPSMVRPRAPLNLGSINLIGQRTSSGWSDYESERLRGGFTYSFDGLHFTPETARRVAKWVVEFLAL